MNEPSKYELAAERLRDGRWYCDPDKGTIIGTWHRPIGHVNKEGRVRLTLRRGDQTYTLRRSRVVYEHVIGAPIPDGLDIWHIGAPDDDSFSNLRLDRTGRPTP